MQKKLRIIPALLICSMLFSFPGCGLLDSNRACNGQFSIHWKMGSEWRAGGGLGTITIKDNLKLTYVGNVVGEFVPPTVGSETYCFEGMNTEGGEGEICIPMGNCNFFVTSLQGEETLVYAPDECMPGLHGPGVLTE